MCLKYIYKELFVVAKFKMQVDPLILCTIIELESLPNAKYYFEYEYEYRKDVKNDNEQPIF